MASFYTLWAARSLASWRGRAPVNPDAPALAPRPGAEVSHRWGWHELSSLLLADKQQCTGGW
jgi:hypothetical protein